MLRKRAFKVYKFVDLCILETVWVIQGRRFTMKFYGCTLESAHEIIRGLPSGERYQLRSIKEYLTSEDNRVCALYGLRRTGKTVLMRQAVQWLISERSVPAEDIVYLTVQAGKIASVVQICEELRKTKCKYVFIDEASWCSDFLSGSSVLYDSITTVHGKKVVIAGTNLVSIYVARKRAMFDRVRSIKVHYLTFYEHCLFRGVSPTYERFKRYLEVGGLFQEHNFMAYIQDSVVEHLRETLNDKDTVALYPWIDAAEYRDPLAVINNILLYAVGTYIDGKNLVSQYKFQYERNCGLNAEIVERLKEYLETPDLFKRGIKHAEVEAFTDFLRDCGLLLTLDNIYRGGSSRESKKYYLTIPFIRYAYTQWAFDLDGIEDPGVRGSLLGGLTEVCAISEYALAYPEDRIYFWRQTVDGTPLECDLVVTDYGKTEFLKPGKAFEIKASSNSSRGQRGYQKISGIHPEYLIPRENCGLYGGEAIASWVYQLGAKVYQKQKEPGRTSAFGDLRGWNVNN